MKYLTSHDGDLIVISCKGSIQERDEKNFKDLVKVCLDANAGAVLFDWSQVTFFDSTGLESLLVFFKTIKANPAVKLGIFITDPDLISAYTTLNFDRIIPIFMTREEAYSNLAPMSTADSPK